MGFLKIFLIFSSISISAVASQNVNDDLTDVDQEVLHSSELDSISADMSVFVGKVHFELHETKVIQRVCTHGSDCPNPVPYWVVVLNGVNGDPMTYQLVREMINAGSRIKPKFFTFKNKEIFEGAKIQLTARIVYQSILFTLLDDVKNITVLENPGLISDSSDLSRSSLSHSLGVASDESLD